jgi:Zn-dependent protease
MKRLFGKRRERNPARELELYRMLSARLELELEPHLELMHSYYEGSLVHLRGRLRGDKTTATAAIIKHCRELGLNAHVTGEPEYVHIKLNTRRRARPSRRWLYPLFALATLLTVLWAGGMHVGVDLLQEPARWYEGLPFALSLLGILVCHEMGHYLTARRYGVDVTPPLLLPVPNPLIGTFGAVIRMRSPVTDRKALFDIGLAGPLSGVVVSIVVIIIGLGSAEIINAAYGELPLSYGPPAMIQILGMNVWLNLPPLFHLLRLLVVGPLGSAEALVLGPVGFAGWLGLFVTALNLIPVGQLDGGHIVYTSMRRAYKPLSTLALLAVLFFAFFWPGWLVWAAVLFFVSRKRPAPLDDVTPLGRGRTLAGYGAMLLFLLCLTPVPVIM